MADGSLRATFGRFAQESQSLPVDPVPSLRGYALLSAAGLEGARILMPPRNYVLDPALTPRLTDRPRLATRLSIEPRAGGGADVWIDAHTGELLATYALLAENNPSIWNCYDKTETTWWECDEVYDEDGETFDYVASLDADQDVLEANYLFLWNQDWMLGTFGRDGFDGQGDDHPEVDMHVYLQINDPSGNASFNAWASADRAEMGFVRNMTTHDIYSHEYGHLWGNYDSGLVYQGESGAVSESIADIYAVWASLAAGEGSPWTIGEGSAGGTLRDICSPDVYGDPDHVDPSISADEIGKRDATSDTDKGFVHTNSGIPNAAWCRIAQGYNERGFEVAAAGTDATRNLFYATVAIGVGANTTLSDYANATWLMAAVGPDRFINGGATTADQVRACHVGNAFASVGLSPWLRDDDCDGVLDNVDTDVDADFVDDAVDNCPEVPNPTQRDLDKDDKGDSCDGDLDGDAVANATDNCPKVANPGQENSGGDEQGDACDDRDEDGVADGKDGCPDAWNASQDDLDGDGTQNACDDDDDGDGVADAVDTCAGVPDAFNSDTDGDTFGDVCDNCVSVANEDQSDCDEDGIGEACETGSSEYCPTEDDWALDEVTFFLHAGDWVLLPSTCPDCALQTGADWSSQELANMTLSYDAEPELDLVDGQGRTRGRSSNVSQVDLMLPTAPGWAWRAPGSTAAPTSIEPVYLMLGEGYGETDTYTVTMSWY